MVKLGKELCCTMEYACEIVCYDLNLVPISLGEFLGQLCFELSLNVYV